MKLKNISNILKSNGFKDIELDNIIESKYVLKRSGGNLSQYLFSFFDKNNKENSEDDINKSWEVFKQKEKKRDNILDGVPKGLPALLLARRIQEKAANVGFDWSELPPVLDKVDEEIAELKNALELNEPKEIKKEMGDVLFSLVNLSRFLDINPEGALRMTISKFEIRFSQVEKELKNRGKSLSNSTLEEMDEIWNMVKKKARG